MAPYYYYEEDLIFGVLSALASSFPSVLLGIAGYVLTALALYTMAQRRGLSKPWLAWIPVVNCWLVGSLSDQYRYVVKRENHIKRKWLLGLNILKAVLTIVLVVLVVVFAVNVIGGAMYRISEQQLMEEVLGLALSLLGVLLPLAGAAIANAVIYYMALYDVYKSLDPNNSVVFLVLSILFKVTVPFFLFFNRNKDNGMPPRKQEQPVYTTYQQPQWQPAEPQQEYWETENKDYL